MRAFPSFSVTFVFISFLVLETLAAPSGTPLQRASFLPAIQGGLLATVLVNIEGICRFRPEANEPKHKNRTQKSTRSETRLLLFPKLVNRLSLPFPPSQPPLLLLLSSAFKLAFGLDVGHHVHEALLSLKSVHELCELVAHL